jgi:hypothetical protein
MCSLQKIDEHVKSSQLYGLTLSVVGITVVIAIVIQKKQRLIVAQLVEFMK